MIKRAESDNIQLSILNETIFILGSELNCGGGGGRVAMTEEINKLHLIINTNEKLFSMAECVGYEENSPASLCANMISPSHKLIDKCSAVSTERSNSAPTCFRERVHTDGAKQKFNTR